ncbi:N-formylglutamate amidohydrolase [Roseobacter sp.]|uniref:N-formylglutamate amidohydrolase n=1 Tax=Roseobacter sp. TaxID=1907202 RepID=UPI00329A6B69
MSDQNANSHGDAVVQVVHPRGASGIVLVCEHASHVFPPEFDHLGLTADMQRGHAAWDPGAVAVARGMSQQLDAPLVAGAVSRLIYDCNRPPEAPSAMPDSSEGRDIPGNIGLSDDARAARAAQYYVPFEAAVRQTMDAADAQILVTMHSFTPVFKGQQRAVQIGILHDDDTRLADAMLACTKRHTGLVTQRNAPYAPQDGVTHTLKLHGLDRGIPNVMLEVRNDLIATPQAQAGMAQMLSGWLCESIQILEATL